MSRVEEVARDAAAGAAPEPPPADAAQRAVDATLARLHLRGGLLALARAELEQMAGVGELGIDSLADLAEARWRSGDAAGATDAARVHVGAGGNEPIPVIIMAESLFAGGEGEEAKALAGQLLERVGGHLDRLFAGEPYSSLWPEASLAPQVRPGSDMWVGLAGGAEVHAPDPEHWQPARGAPPATSGPEEPDRARVSFAQQLESGRAVGEELALVEEAIDGARLLGVAERLALLLRHDPQLAAVVLAGADRALAGAAGDTSVNAALHIVRGDAYRSLGHEADADAAYGDSLRALAADATTMEET